MHEVLVNPLGGLSLPRKSVVRLIGRPDMTLDVYRGGKTTITTILITPFSQAFRVKLIDSVAFSGPANKLTKGRTGSNLFIFHATIF